MTSSRLLLTAALAVTAAGTIRSAGAQSTPTTDSITFSVDRYAAYASVEPIDARFLVEPTDTIPRRRARAIQYSDWYARRLTIHRYASYTMLPIFAAEYVLGDKMLDEKRDAFAGRGNGVSDQTRTPHQYVAGAVGTLFAVNTVTGLWNLIESRHEPKGRTRRTVHTLLMLGADAGFVATGVLGARAADHGVGEATTHRNVALGSMGIATAGAVMMWFFR